MKKKNVRINVRFIDNVLKILNASARFLLKDNNGFLHITTLPIPALQMIQDLGHELPLIIIPSRKKDEI